MADAPLLDAAALDDLVEAWETNQRIHLLLLDDISDEGLAATLSTRGGRDVARQFAHVHTQRVRWLAAKGAGDLADGLRKFESKEQPTRAELIEAMNASAATLSIFFRDVGTGSRPLRGQKKGPLVSLAYFVAHESHHRGGILLTLKQCGHKLDKDLAYGIWDWHRH